MDSTDTISDRALRLARLTVVRRIITALAVTASALLQAFVIQAFVNPADLLPSGFTGIAVLLDRITALGGVRIDTSLGMLALNIPVALLCWRSISHRFVLFSMMQVALSSLFLQVCDFAPLLDDKMLLVVFGGFLSGISIALALKAGASTGGTDFIALLVSNRTGKTIWGFVFAGNCIVLVIFGALFGWDNAAYAIVFQFISTKSIDSFYHRYDRVTLQVTTRRADEIMRAYIERFQHGISGDRRRLQPREDVPAARGDLDLRVGRCGQAHARDRPRRGHQRAEDRRLHRGLVARPCGRARAHRRPRPRQAAHALLGRPPARLAHVGRRTVAVRAGSQLTAVPPGTRRGRGRG